jgi:hypothetical protein
MLQEIVDHVIGGWNGYSTLPPTHSEFISTSASFAWSIWETSRRLEKLNMTYVDLSLIRRWGYYAPTYRGTKASHFDAVEALKYCRAHSQGRDVVDSEYQKAIRFARASSEVLFYIKIFNKDILETTRWDRYVSIMGGNLKSNHQPNRGIYLE